MTSLAPIPPHRRHRCRAPRISLVKGTGPQAVHPTRHESEWWWAAWPRGRPARRGVVALGSPGARRRRRGVRRPPCPIGEWSSRERVSRE